MGVQVEFQFQLLQLLPHDLRLHKQVATAEVMAFQYRLFPARIELPCSNVRYDSRWRRQPLLSFSEGIYCACRAMKERREFAFELPEGNDELVFSLKGDVVEFWTDIHAEVARFQLLDFVQAAEAFSEAALTEVCRTYPEIRANREFAGFYPDRKSLAKLGF